MKNSKWDITTFVVQHVGLRGQWYDFATLNTDPRFVPDGCFTDDLREKLMPKDAPWRIIERVATETILEEHE